MALPPIAELRRRLIAFGGWRPERAQEVASASRPLALDLASRLAHGLWNTMCQVDPRVFWAFGVPMYISETPPRHRENRA
jgi:hypothetical protein